MSHPRLYYYRQTVSYPPSENEKLPREYQLIDIPLCAIGTVCEETASPDAVNYNPECRRYIGKNVPTAPASVALPKVIGKK